MNPNLKRVLMITAAVLLSAAGFGAAPNSESPLVKAREPDPQPPVAVPLDIERPPFSAGSGMTDTAPFSDVLEASRQIRAFSIDLYHALRGRPGNLLFSPYSIHTALTMTYAGAAGITANEMEETLSLSLPPQRLHAAVSTLSRRLEGEVPAEYRGGESVAAESDRVGPGKPFTSAESLWGQKGSRFEPEFLHVLARYYGANLNLVDFQRSPEAARQTVNRWAEQETGGLVGDLLKPGTITPLTMLVLTNAIYYHSGWAAAFDPARTKPGEFRIDEETIITVPMMQRDGRYGFVRDDVWTAVEIPYAGHLFSMVLVIPDHLALFEGGITPELLDKLLDGIEYRTMRLSLPTFTIADDIDLAAVLAGMGMGTAFSGAADFSGMQKDGGLMISDVVHKAVIEVDEAGTTAAAATAVVMTKSASPIPALQVTADRPFLFFIRDIDTGTLLFIGRVMRPDA